MDLLKMPRDLRDGGTLLARRVLQKGIGQVSKRLVNLQQHLRVVGRLVPASERQELRPALPYGEGFERFQNQVEALKSWPDKQTQWWYFTGHLVTREGRRFSFQYVNFERHASEDFFGPLPTRVWTDEYHVSHFALSNIDAKPGEKPFRYFQRGGLQPHNGFSSEDRFHVDLDGWYMHQEDDKSFRLLASEDGTTLQLKVESEKPLCYHGQQGYAAKTANQEDGSLYCSFTRLKASGKILIDGILHEVTGSAWMDHEKMVADDRILHNGWDWYSLQLDNACELMLYLLKDEHGALTPHALGTFFDADGQAHPIAAHEIEFDRVRSWQSPKTKVRWPVENRVRVPKLGIDLRVEPFLDNQEMDTSKTAFVTYWEGGVSATGSCQGQPVQGRGYLELVGYDQRPRCHVLKFLTLPPA